MFGDCNFLHIFKAEGPIVLNFKRASARTQTVYSAHQIVDLSVFRISFTKNCPVTLNIQKYLYSLTTIAGFFIGGLSQLVLTQSCIIAL